MRRALERFFDLHRHGTTVGREAVAGLTTFVTMAYIIVVNPKILEAAGMPFGAAMAATILTAAFGTLAMGRPAPRLSSAKLALASRPEEGCDEKLDI